MRPWLTVLEKELMDLRRDRRTMINILLLGALLGPLLAMAILMLTMKMVSDEIEKLIELPVQGAEYAPALMAYLRQHKIAVAAPLHDPVRALSQQEADAVLIIPAEFPQQLRQGSPAALELLSDHSRSRTRIVRQRIKAAISRYSATIGSLRLSLRGIDPAVNRPIITRDRDLASDSGATQILVLLPYLLIIGIMQAAMVVAADLTAGERERQTLESLLVNPVPPGQVMLGKLAANFVVSLMVLALSLTGFVLGSRLIAASELGMDLQWGAIPLLILALAPLTFLFAALMTFVAAFARTVKEAQTYLTLLVLAAIVPSMIQMLMQMKVAGLQLLIPIWSHNYLVNELLRGESMAATDWVLPALGAICAGGVFTLFAARLYNRPGLIFST